MQQWSKVWVFGGKNNITIVLWTKYKVKIQIQNHWKSRMEGGQRKSGKMTLPHMASVQTSQLFTVLAECLHKPPPLSSSSSSLAVMEEKDWIYFSCETLTLSTCHMPAVWRKSEAMEDCRALGCSFSWCHSLNFRITFPFISPRSVEGVWVRLCE